MVWGDDLSANKLKKTYVKGDLDISAGNVIVQNSGNLMVMSQTEGLASITFSTTNINIFDGENQYDMSYSTFGALNAIGVSFEESTGELLLRTKYISSSTISDIKKTLIGNVDTSCSLFVYGNTVCTMDSSINGVIRVGGGATIGGAIDVVGDAVVAHLALQLFVSARDFGRGLGTVDVAEFKEALPMRAQRRLTGVGLGAQLVPVSGVGRGGHGVRPVQGARGIGGLGGRVVEAHGIRVCPAWLGAVCAIPWR
jgi:hypothetical protein